VSAVTFLHLSREVSRELKVFAQVAIYDWRFFAHAKVFRGCPGDSARRMRVCNTDAATNGLRSIHRSIGFTMSHCREKIVSCPLRRRAGGKPEFLGELETKRTTENPKNMPRAWQIPLRSSMENRIVALHRLVHCVLWLRRSRSCERLFYSDAGVFAAFFAAAFASASAFFSIARTSA